jgi:predicted DNA-binding transcriptional regulator YafY
VRSDRLLSILLLLQVHGRLNARQLADQLEVSERTIHRDVEALSAAGVPVYTERGRHGGIALVPGYRTDVSGLTVPEARALFIFAGRGALADLGLEDELRSALRKLLSVLPEVHRSQAEQASERVVIDPQGWLRDREEVPHLATAQEAVWRERRLRVRYRRPGAAEARERLLDPYGLVDKAGTWYLVAGDGGEPRLYRVGRIEAAELTEQPAERPPDLDLEALWEELRQRAEDRGASVEVRVRVQPGRLALLRQLLGSSVAGALRDPPAEGGDEPSGGLVLTLRFPAEAAARAALLGFAADLEVLHPPTLRRAMAEAGRELLGLYGGEDALT